MSCLNMALEMVRAGKSIIPIQPKGKKPALRSWEEFQARIATEEEVRGWFDKNPNINIGLVCGAVSGVVAVDVDGEEGQEWFKANMDPKPNCFQYTSSAHKFHAFYAHPGERIPPAVGLAKEVDVRGDGSYVVFAPSVHESGAVYTLKHLPGFTGWDSLVPCPELEKYRQKKRPEKIEREKTTLSAEDGGRNDALTRLVGRCLAKNMSEEEAACFAAGWNEKHCNPPLDETEVTRTVSSVYQTHARNNPMALNTDGIRKWVLAIPGQFKVSELDTELGIKEKDDKLQRTVVLEGMCKEGLIERVGQTRGVYRIRDKSMNVLSIDDHEEPEVNLWLPFGLNQNVRIQQKNIIIVAGETNAGKTSLLMNMAWMQARSSNSRYLCSEMTGPELKSKTQSFGQMDRWQRVEFVERTSGYHDVVLPHGITFIDYLEVYDNFFRIGEEIRAIYDALKTGVAVIALQKATGSDLGRGGAFTIEKARLALSLFSHGKMLDGIIGSAKVVKAKNIKPGFNPEGREIFYTLRNGYYFDAGDIPGSISDLKRGWRFYDKKARDKICQRIESYCRDREVNDEMSNVEFYS